MNSIEHIDKIYCLHHLPAVERKNKMLTIFSALDLDVEFIEGYLPEQVIQHEGFKNIAESSLYYKHYHCFKDQVQHGYKNILIIEDDATIPANFIPFTGRCMQEFLAMKGDLLMIGGCCGIHPPNVTPDRFVYHQPDFRTRCTHCYVVNESCVKYLADHMEEKYRTIDFKLNQLITDGNLKSCYVEPQVHQDSQKGLYKSLLSN